MTNLKPKSGPVLLALSLAVSLFTVTPAFAQVDANFCGTLANAFGPFDYRPDRDTQSLGSGTHTHKLWLVESAHFTKNVELLIRGNSGGVKPGGDLDYTLRAFPNHHRALISVMRYGEKEVNPKPPGLRYVVECYFERAIRFASDDAIARIIYASYLTKNKRATEAVTQLEQATRIAGENAFTHYNVGLAYFDMKIYDKSLAQAHKALALGFERTELRDLLQKTGQWREPVTATAEKSAEKASDVVEAPVADTSASAPQ